MPVAAVSVLIDYCCDVQIMTSQVKDGSVPTAGHCPLRCGDETAQVITCVTPVDSTTAWTASADRSANPARNW